ncbi:MAG: hypothetical protein ACTSO9_06575 [Candidatus Helarchaeota archaeon]
MTENERKAEDVVAGGGLVLISGLITGLFGWIWGVVASRSDIGFGAAGFGIFSMANSITLTLMAISGGFNQAFSKKISESLVVSNELAQKYSRSGFKIAHIFGFCFLIPLMAISVFLFIIQDSLLGVIFFSVAITLYLFFIRDALIGQLGGIQRFDLIAIVNFMIVFGGVLVGFLILFIVPPPENSILILIVLFTGPLTQIFVEVLLLRKALPYSLKSSIFGETNKEITSDTLKYGLYCILPMVILNGSIYMLQVIFYSMFFRPAPTIPIPLFQKLSLLLFPESSIISISATLIGYASVMNAAAVMAWPLVPALSEAKAKNDQKSIDEFVLSTFRAGWNLTSFFIVIYVGLAYTLLYLLHGPEYTPGHIPFIIQSCAVAVTSLNFLISSVLMGLGEGKKAAIFISLLMISQIILIPILIIILKVGNVYNALYAGPVALLIISSLVLLISFRYLLKFTNNTRSTYFSILGKGTISVLITITISFFIDFYLYPYYQNLTSFLIGAVILGGVYLLAMLFFAGYGEDDFKMLENFGLGKFVKLARYITEHSPFYKEPEKTVKNTQLEEKPRNENNTN